MFETVLFQPEIPPNTGSIMRLCAATHTRLHLIEPLGFTLSHKALQRSSMDYRQRVNVQRHPNWHTCQQTLLSENPTRSIYAITTKGHIRYDQVIYKPYDVLLFGPETRGLPTELLYELPITQRIRIPMYKNERSLNLAMSVAIILYEALRQQNFTQNIQ